MNYNIFRKTLIWIMNTIAYNTKDTATVFMLLLAIWWGNELVNTDHVPIKKKTSISSNTISLRILLVIHILPKMQRIRGKKLGNRQKGSTSNRTHTRRTRVIRKAIIKVVQTSNENMMSCRKLLIFTD